MGKDGVLRTIDASPVGAALVAYLAAVPGGFEGILSDLLDRLDRYRPHGEAWPRSAKGLADALRRLAPALRRIGFECKPLHKSGGVIRWNIFSKPAPAEASPQCPQSPSPQATPANAPAGHSGPAGLQGLQGLQGRGVSSQGPEKGMPSSHDTDPADDGEVF